MADNTGHGQISTGTIKACPMVREMHEFWQELGEESSGLGWIRLG